jgi:hypothetical protein
LTEDGYEETEVLGVSGDTILFYAIEPEMTEHDYGEEYGSHIAPRKVLYAGIIPEARIQKINIY